MALMHVTLWNLTSILWRNSLVMIQRFRWTYGMSTQKLTNEQIIIHLKYIACYYVCFLS